MSLMMDDEMTSAFNIIKSTIDLLQVSKNHLLKSGLAESTAPLLVVETVITELKETIHNVSGMCRLCGQDFEGNEHTVGGQGYKDCSEGGNEYKMSFAHTTIASQRDVMLRKKSRPSVLVSQLSNISTFSNKSNMDHNSDNEDTSNRTPKENGGGGFQRVPSTNSLLRVNSLGSLFNRSQPASSIDVPTASTSTTGATTGTTTGTATAGASGSDSASTSDLHSLNSLNSKRYGRGASLKELECFNEKQVKVPELTSDGDYIMKVKAQEAFMILDTDHSGTLDSKSLFILSYSHTVNIT